MEVLWASLTEEQRADFERALADGRLGNMVALWEPWWAAADEVCARFPFFSFASLLSWCVSHDDSVESTATVSYTHLTLPTN